MDPRRGDRPSQVRPRPPSSGRRTAARARAVTPSPTRIGGYRRIERRRGLPLVAKLVLALCIVMLGGAVLWTGSRAVGPTLSSAVAGFGGLVAQVGNLAGSPRPTQTPDAASAPTINPRPETVTNRETVDLTINLPIAVTGKPDYTLRVYVTLKDAQPVILLERPVASTAVQVITAVPLSPGRNDLQAAIFGPGGESERSQVAAWILDQSKPKISIVSPKNNAQVKQSPVTVKGKSQAGAEIRLANASNGAIATATAGTDGLWATTIEVGNGGNGITVTATDPAGNQNTTTLNVRKGSGRLTAILNGSAYRFSASKLPRKVTFTVTVTDPDGRRLAGAVALFTVSVPQINTIVSGEIRTDGNGVASFTTNIPSGAMKGLGLATVLVTTDRAGSVSDRQVLTVVD